jgi:parvulin-like peptidyl-prolyl isomerase
MPKHNRSGQSAFVLKNQQSGKKRKKPLSKMFVTVTLIVCVIVVGVLGWSIYNFKIKPYNQAAVKFNGVTFDMRYFTNALKLYYGKAPTDTSVSDFADYVEQQIEHNQTIIQGSAALGVQIDRKDIEDELKNSGVPVTRESVDLLMAQELVAKQVPDSQPQVHVQAMLLESEAAAQEAINRLQAGEPFDEVAGALSRASVSQIVNGDLGWVTAREADLTVGSTNFGDIVSGAETGVFSGPVYDDTVSKQLGYWVAEAVEKTDASDNTTVAEVHVQGLLLGSEQAAQDVINQINNGADIDELAKQLSQQPGAADNGAELGWISRSQDAGDFDALFDLPLHTVVGPVSDNQTQTTGGYWVFNVPEKNDSKALTDYQKNMLQNDLFDRCTAELEKDPDYEVKNLLTQDQKDRALNEAVLAQGEGSVLIGTNSLPNAEVGVSYYQKLEVYGNQKGNKWSITQGSLPEGLSLNTSTGVISGIPKFAGGSGFTVRVDSNLHYSTQELVISLHLPVSVDTSSLPDGQVGVDYDATLEAFGDTNSYTWSIISGSLPDGLELTGTTGDIHGIPATAGTYNFTVQVDDGLNKATKELSILIQ